MMKNLRCLGLLGALFLTSAVVQAQVSYVDANATNTQAVGGTRSPFFTTASTSDIHRARAHQQLPILTISSSD